jgi:probable HAF family extracellular repeat protein
MGLRQRIGLIHAAMGLAIVLLGGDRVLASPFYSVQDLGIHSPTDLPSISIDSQGNVSYSPNNGLNFGNSATGPVPAGDNSYDTVATGSDNGLYTAGTAYNPVAQQFDGYIVSGGKVTLLSPIDPSVPGSAPRPFAVNNAGQTAGYASWSNGTGGVISGPAISTPGQGSQLISTTGGDAFAINNLGKVVGAYIPQPQISAQTDAFLWSGGKLYDLNTLVGLGSGWSMTTATGINDAGQIVGYATDPSGQYHALLLTPTDPSNPWPGNPSNTPPPTPAPEPSTLAFLGMVVLVLAGRRGWARNTGQGG